VHIIMVAAIFSLLTFCHAMASVFDAQTVVDLINKDRSERQIAPLEINNKLSEAAKEKAHDMFEHGYFAHNSPSGVTPWSWIEQSGYDYAYAGENLAINFTDAQAQHAALMNSESHKKNILNAKYQDVGVAVVEGSMDGRQTIITVQEFGALAGAVSPASKTLPAGSVKGENTDSIKTKAPVTDFQKVRNFSDGVVGNLTKNVLDDPYSNMGMAYVYVLVMLLSLQFFIYELFAGHVHLFAHLHSLRLRIRALVRNDAEQNQDPHPVAVLDGVHFEKIYLTHMKMRK